MAIIAVMVAHYCSYYAFDFYQQWLREYASEMVSIFFVLAGLGSVYSFRNLERRSDKPGMTVRMALDYYAKRALRIYPLYWLSLFTIPFILPGFGELHSFSAYTLGIYLAYPAVKAPGVYWFIPALVQCYLLAPFIYLAFRKLELRNYIIALTVSTGLLMLVTRYFWQLLELEKGFGIPDPEALVYRPLVLGNVVLFAIGTALPALVSIYPARYRKNIIVLASAAAFMLMLYLVRDPDMLFRQSQYLFFPLFMLSVSLFCLTTIASGPRMPLRRILIPLGDNSYPLYLFHRQYYGLLALAGLVTQDSLASVAVTIVLFPLFFIVCSWLEKGSTWLADSVSLRFSPPRRVPLPEADL